MYIPSRCQPLPCILCKAWHFISACFTAHSLVFLPFTWLYSVICYLSSESTWKASASSYLESFLNPTAEVPLLSHLCKCFRRCKGDKTTKWQPIIISLLYVIKSQLSSGFILTLSWQTIALGSIYTNLLRLSMCKWIHLPIQPPLCKRWTLLHQDIILNNKSMKVYINVSTICTSWPALCST